MATLRVCLRFFKLHYSHSTSLLSPYFGVGDCFIGGFGLLREDVDFVAQFWRCATMPMPPVKCRTFDREGSAIGHVGAWIKVWRMYSA